MIKIFKAALLRLVCLLKGHVWVENGTRTVTITRFIYDEDTGYIGQVPEDVEVTRYTCSRCPKELHSDPIPHKYERGY